MLNCTHSATGVVGDTGRRGDTDVDTLHQSPHALTLS